MTVSTNPRGTTFARVALLVAKNGGSIITAATDAEETFGPHNDVARILKSAVAVGSLGSGWGSQLDGWRGASAEVLELVRNASIIGRLPGLRKVPLDVRVIRQTGGTTGHWVAENAPIPVGQGAFAEATLKPAKLAGIVVASDEMTRGGPLADAILRDDLVAALASASDAAFISNSAGVAGQTPAGAMATATVIPATSDPKADLAAMIAAFGGTLERAVFVMNPITATQLSGADYPGIGARGGVLLGLPVVTSSAVPAGQISLVDPGRIAYGENPMIEVDASREASLQMDTAPDNPGTAATVLVSLFQVNATAIRAVMYANWSADSTGVLLTGAAY